jgi:CRP-like cAMP-binding protein
LGDCLHFIIEGSVSICAEDGDGHELILAYVNKNELSKTFSQWLTITKYHPSTIIRADTIFCSSHEEFEDTKGAIRNCKGK